MRNRLLPAILSLISLLFCAAPTPGDIGSCGQKSVDLDPGIFFASKDAIDCDRCKECDLRSKLCDDACAGENGGNVFPEHCQPLVHDGEVCLRALTNASCSDYAGYMSERSPSVPTECNFCPAQ
jgi:hypothetical protein